MHILPRHGHLDDATVWLAFQSYHHVEIREKSDHVSDTLAQTLATLLMVRSSDASGRSTPCRSGRLCQDQLMWPSFHVPFSRLLA